jgi:dihydrofolate synthase/folylpolyglutamate synthase
VRAKIVGLDPHVYLESLVHFGQKFGLETIQSLCEGLGHPERAYTTFLIAGTNGKGSVAAYLDHALRAAGRRVGRYTSPHLVRVNERIVVGGREIEDHELAAALARVQAVVAQPTYFEALTAAAFDHFRAAGVDVAVLEVGMGGRLDATNVADPLVSAIVSIDFDHQAYLGTTLGAIAHEKAGVLRPGRVTVVGPLPDEAMAAVNAQAAVVGAHIRVASEEGPRLDAPLPGAHQRDNRLVAVRVLEAAAEAGFAIDLEAATAGLAGTQWPGRLQWIPGEVPLLLDGAHNIAGARALAAYLDARGEPFVLLFGAMRDKAFADMAAILFPRAREVVLTMPPVARAATADELLAVAPRTGHAVPDVGAALALACRRAHGVGPVVVAGSLYLVGAVLALIEGSGGPSAGPPASPTRGDR